MNEEQEEPIRGRDLPSRQFLRLLLLGSARSARSGVRLVLDPRQKSKINVIAGHLPLLFLILIFSGILTPSWPKVIVFLTILVFLYFYTMRLVRLVEVE